MSWNFKIEAADDEVKVRVQGAVVILKFSDEGIECDFVNANSQRVIGTWASWSEIENGNAILDTSA